MARTPFRYIILNNRGEPHAGGNSLTDMMLLMSTRWAGKLVTDTGAVVFELPADRNCAGTHPNAAERRAELMLAESRALVEV